MKLHSHTPGTCIKATLWVCYGRVMEDRQKVSSPSEHSQEERAKKSRTSNGRPTVDRSSSSNGRPTVNRSSSSNGRPTVDRSRLDSLIVMRDDGLINPLNSRPTMLRLKRAAVLSGNNQASSSTTPKTCELSQYECDLH